jgi:hypothetical protein
VSKLWRIAAVVTAAGSLLAAGGLPALATNRVTPSVTAKATSRMKITGDTLVLYRGGRDSVADISGKVSGATKGDVLKLYAQRFGNTPGVIWIARARTRYTFKVHPYIVTSYQVKLFASDNTLLASSGTVKVYVSSGGVTVQKRGCPSGPVCRPSYRVYEFLPPAVAKAEAHKHWYIYVGVRLSPTTHLPPVPKWLYLDRRATVSAPRRISASNYERTVGFSFRIGNDSARWKFLACAKDSEATDGFGLPGRHGCGLHRVRSDVAYLG